MKQILILVLAVFASLGAHAQDIGVIAGISNTSADIDGAEVNSILGYRLGVAVKIDMVQNWYFRTGATYTSRPFNITNTAVGTDVDAKFSYVDIPALFQFQINPMVGIYIGPVIAINVSDKLDGKILNVPYSGSIGDYNSDNKIKPLYLLGQVGVNFNFDGLGFDAYYERGMGDIYKGGAKDYSIIGANFLWWF